MPVAFNTFQLGGIPPCMRSCIRKLIWRGHEVLRSNSEPSGADVGGAAS